MMCLLLYVCENPILRKDVTMMGEKIRILIFLLLLLVFILNHFLFKYSSPNLTDRAHYRSPDQDPLILKVILYMGHARWPRESPLHYVHTPINSQIGGADPAGHIASCSG